MSKDRKFTVVICTIAVLFAIVIKCAPIYYFNTGKADLKKHNYVAAYKNIKKAYNFDSQNKDYRYYYVQILTKLSPTFTVQKEMFELASSTHKDSAQDIAENKVSEWRMKILNSIGDNYIEQASTDKGIVRWDTEKFPLNITIQDNSGIAIPPYYKEEIKNAFRQWQNSVKFITFQNVDRNADIIVSIQPLPDDICSENNCRYVVGYTVPDIKGKTLHKMTIVLYAKDPYGNFFSDKELYNTILHEIGHALGIMGHSYSSEDLMYMASEKTFYSPYRSSFQYLSSKDINTLKLLYKLVPDVTNTNNINTKGLIYTPIILGTAKDISLRKLKEAQNYVKQAPELPGGYIDLATAYSELGKNKDAVQALNKALDISKTNNDKYICLYNLAVVNMNIKKFDKALEYANMAKDISDTEEIKDLISNINHTKITKIKLFKN